MALYASWVHGTVAMPILSDRESGLALVNGIPGTDVVGQRAGTGVTFRGKAGRTIEFLFPIPTPVLIEGKHVWPAKFFVMFWADTEAIVDSFHVYDGANKIHAFDHLAVTGNRSDVIDLGTNAFGVTAGPPTPPIVWGMAITVIVTFNSESGIAFASAGADFVTI